MALVACPDCGEQVLEGVRSCPFCESRAREVFSGGGAFRPFAAGGKSWGSSAFLTAGIVAAVVSGLCAGAYTSTSDSGWLSASTLAGFLALVWLLIGAVARGVAVGMREHDEN